MVALQAAWSRTAKLALANRAPVVKIVAMALSIQMNNVMMPTARKKMAASIVTFKVAGVAAVNHPYAMKTVAMAHSMRVKNVMMPILP